MLVPFNHEDAARLSLPILETGVLPSAMECNGTEMPIF